MSGREGVAGLISKLCNNKRRRIGPELSMSEVVTSPPYNLDKPHGLVASNTHTHDIIVGMDLVALGIHLTVQVLHNLCLG